jgi:hypothetical protein
MIAPLRTAHRWIWTLLALLLPALLYAALSARTQPTGDGMPADLTARAAELPGAENP